MGAGDRARPATVWADPAPVGWYRDPLGCLHTAIGSVLHGAGVDPLEVLGAARRFTQQPGDHPYSEYYLPVRPGGDVAAAIAPHHRLSLHWADGTGDPHAAVSELAEHLRRGRYPLPTVDNFHLPFRPAHHDVHAAHLLVVDGVDLARDVVHVLDVMPPAFHGYLPVDTLMRAWTSANPADEEDAFFSETRLTGRYLVLDPTLDISPLTPQRLREVITADLHDFVAPPITGATDPTCRTGRRGLDEYLEEIIDAARQDDSELVRRVYPESWHLQAGAALHGELLRTRGHAWSVPDLMVAGREIERLAHTWTGLRISAAHHWPRPRAAADTIARSIDRLRRYHVSAYAATLQAVEALSTTGDK